MTQPNQPERSEPMINMRCEVCGNAVRVPRAPYDPKRAVERVTSECDICHAAEGGFEQCWYFDRNGNELRPDNDEEYYG